MIKLKIDPEFRDKIPPLTEAEFEQLKENILSDGEVYEPIVVWNDTIVDGYNRWRIICENWELLKDKFRTKPMDFADKWAAFEWMYKKQLGRRNLTEEQKSYMVGKMYEARKRSQGGDRRSEEFSNGQNVHLKDRREVKDGTAGEIGKEIGVDGRTVRRAEKFAKGIDALRENNPEAATAVLKGNSGATKAEISELPGKTASEIQKVAQDILTGEIKKDRPKREKPDKENLAAIGKIVDEMYDASNVKEYTMDMLVEDIQINGKMAVDMLRSILTSHSTLLTVENRPAVGEAIEKYFIEEFKKVKELVSK